MMIELIIWVRKFFGGTSVDAMSIFDKTLVKLEKVEQKVKAEVKRIDKMEGQVKVTALDALNKAEEIYRLAKENLEAAETKQLSRVNSLAKRAKVELEENKQYAKNIKAVLNV